MGLSRKKMSIQTITTIEKIQLARKSVPYRNTRNIHFSFSYCKHTGTQLLLFMHIVNESSSNFPFLETKPILHEVIFYFLKYNI